MDDVRFLVSYLVDKFDEVGSVAARFGINTGSIVAANELTLEVPYTLSLPCLSPSGPSPTYRNSSCRRLLLRHR